MSAAPAEKVKLFDVEHALRDTFESVVLSPGGLGEQFFHESEFGTFTGLDLEQARQTLGAAVDSGDLICLLGLHKGEPVGFILFSVSRHYTTEPMAQLFLFYVQRKRRLSPLGRGLVFAAEKVARELGACVFYMGATANVGNGVDERMMNMLDKFGYFRLGGVSRKILGDDHE